jgi:hypothetical protein
LATLRELKELCKSYIDALSIDGLTVYADEPLRLKGMPCVTMLTRRGDPIQAETGPHDDVVYEWRLRLYVALQDYSDAQAAIDDILPQLLSVPRHHATMEGLVDFFVFTDPGGEPLFSTDDKWASKDVTARVQRTEL